MVPELVPTRDLHRTRRKVPIQLKNMTDQPIKLEACMLVGQVSAATPVLLEEVRDSKNSQQLQKEFQHCSDVLPPFWQKRVKSQLMRWEKLFAKDNFDVGCASAKHRIRLQEDKPFQEQARRVPLSDLREQLAELKRSGVESRGPLCIPYCGGAEEECVFAHVYQLSNPETVHHTRPIHHTPH